MSATGEQPHFSTRMLDLGLRFQNVPQVAKWVSRAATPAYMRLQWQSMPEVDPDSIAWAEEVAGDPEAGRLPRNWNNAAVLGASRQALAELGAHDPENQRYGQDVVAYDHDGVVVVGSNPESPHIFGGAPAWYNGDDLLTVAMRRGRGPLKAAMGHYTPEQGLMVPEGIVVVQESIPVQDIANKFPHTRLV